MSFQYANDAAMGNLDYERNDNDLYSTPAWVTEALIPHLKGHPFFLTSDSVVWEPACGKGAMSTVLQQHFNNVYISDKYDYGLGYTIIDFLEAMSRPIGCEIIITNPPYGKAAEDFIRHALWLTSKVSGKVAMLLRNEYDSAKERSDLFCNEPFAKKVILTSRPRWIEGSTGSPRHNYAWYIWDWNRELPVQLGYGHKGAIK